MRSKDVDPSLCAGEPLLESLEDGFSPPAREEENGVVPPPQADEGPQAALGPKSPF